MNDTIAAISTTLGVGAISIIRVSGKQAIEIVNKIFSSDLSKKESHTISYGFIKENNENIDEVLISLMRAPKTFTKEDVVEINCHGGIATTKKVLELVLEQGARLAEPGEFTKRAFLNGRIDLVEAEAVMDLINVKTEKSRMIAMNNLKGKTTLLIKNIRQEILDLLANIEVNIDYPEYEDIEQVTRTKLKHYLEKIEAYLKDVYEKSNNTKIIKEGINVAIVGRPNVGKSSILNALLNEERAIVTNIAGTTRDIVEGSINLDGILLNLIDTAGIRETSDIVEKIGVEKSKNIISSADLVLVVLNSNEQITKEDKEILKEVENKKHIIILNKNDLEKKINYNFNDINNVITTSTITEEGITSLKKKIKEIFNVNELEQQDFNYLSNFRQINLLKEAIDSLKDAKESLNNNMDIDIIEIDIKNIWTKLGEIIGENYSDELIDELFSQFCLGK